MEQEIKEKSMDKDSGKVTEGVWLICPNWTGGTTFYKEYKY